MLTPVAPELLHIVGYLTGATLYAMLLSMVMRTGGGGDRLTIATALLGLGWNVGELSVLAFQVLALPGAGAWMSAASYAALGFLAAVAVHSASQAQASEDPPIRRRWRRLVAAIAYASAGLAAGLQAGAAARGGLLPSSPALLLLTAGLAAVVLPLVLLTRRQAQWRRVLWMTALALFAVSALHLGSHGTSESWTMELLGHHASIPLAFAILYQDYRFAFADLFLKRALSLLALVGLVFVAWSAVATAFAESSLRPESAGALLAIWIATVLLFPWIQRGITAFVDRVILLRTGYATLLDELAGTIQRDTSAETVLTRTCDVLARALGATAVTWRTSANLSGLATHEIGVPTAEPPYYVLAVERLAGGRRLLSDDEAMLERAAFLLARRIDALRISEERYERILREREIGTLATEAELRALRAQINPHFLFNTLTTLGYLIQQAPPRALDTLMRLTTLLRGALRSEGEFTTLGHERELIEAYLQIERERFEERLQVAMDIPDHLTDVPLPALIVQPIVENAIKHGIARARSGGLVSVTARRESDPKLGSVLRIVVRNTGASLVREFEPVARRQSLEQVGSLAGVHGTGIGLQNVARRLDHYYGAAAALTLTTDADGATKAEIRLPTGGASTVHVPAVAGRIRS